MSFKLNLHLTLDSEVAVPRLSDSNHDKSVSIEEEK